MRFGVHLSTGGNLANAPRRGKAIGCHCMQIFSGNPRGWAKKPLDPTHVQTFRAAVVDAKIDPVVVHATYLINLAAPDREMYRKSVNAFIDELKRSETLGAAFYVVHCGSHKGTGETGGRERIIAALRKAAEAVPNGPTVLLENTAGTKNSLGTTFEDLAVLLDGAHLPKTGICLDTCHALAAGYEIRTPKGLSKTLDNLSDTVGLSRLRLLHINDSKGDLGSHLDRHENIGEGCIGRRGFKTIFSEPRLQNLPAILETPVDEPEDDLKNLWRVLEIAVHTGALPKETLEFMPTAELDPIAQPKAIKKRKVVARKKFRKVPEPPKPGNRTRSKTGTLKRKTTASSPKKIKKVIKSRSAVKKPGATRKTKLRYRKKK